MRDLTVCIYIDATIYHLFDEICHDDNFASLMCVWGCVCAGITLCMCLANERWRYNVTSSLIGWAHTQKDPWCVVVKDLGALEEPGNPLTMMLHEHYGISNHLQINCLFKSLIRLTAKKTPKLQITGLFHEVTGRFLSHGDRNFEVSMLRYQAESPFPVFCPVCKCAIISNSGPDVAVSQIHWL